jgi:hypothetical protein
MSLITLERPVPFAQDLPLWTRAQAGASNWFPRRSLLNVNANQRAWHHRDVLPMRGEANPERGDSSLCTRLPPVKDTQRPPIQ